MIEEWWVWGACWKLYRWIPRFKWLYKWCFTWLSGCKCLIGKKVCMSLMFNKINWGLMLRCPSDSWIQWFEVQKNCLIRNNLLKFWQYKKTKNNSEKNRHGKSREINYVCECSFKKEYLIDSINVVKVNCEK